MTDRDAARSHYLDTFRIDVSIRAGVPRLLPATVLVRTLIRALQAGGAPIPARIGLTLTDDAHIARLNEQHMGHEGATDVLSFPLLDPGAYPAHEGQDPTVRTASGPAFVLPPGMRTDLGEIVVSVERAIEQAEQGRGGHTSDIRWSPADELRLLITHGALHVCGWDHALPAEEAAMRALERQLSSSAPGSPRARSR
jgi:probable rRNA maturation factor